MHRPMKTLSLGLLAGLCVSTAHAQEPIAFTKETLPNGLTVIYAPMKNAPVVHVRVLYHVGSRDERADRQGFAHMFEHMMFRGSAHVAPEQHMKLIGTAGGDSNAFTSFDQTTYTNTLPSTGLEMALYMEADRMASFKVNDEIFQTERNVVAEEWRMRYANQPTGPMIGDVMKLAYENHGYRWTPIGDMDQLRQATSSELQTFFNTYYVPNNACLVIAGDYDDAQARAWVKRYFGWIPAGPEVKRIDRPEPPQTETRRLVVEKPNVPLTNMMMVFKGPEYRSEDTEALYVLGEVLSSGRTGRLDRKLVYGEKPMCVSVGAGSWQLEDPSPFMINAVLQKEADPATVEKVIFETIQDIVDRGVTDDELQQVRTQAKQTILKNREKAEDVATQLAEEEVFGGDANRVNQALEKLARVTSADVQAVARKYLRPEAMTNVQYRNGPGADPTTQAAKAATVIDAAVAKSAEAVPPRITTFPADYPTTIPKPAPLTKVTLAKGEERLVRGVKVVTLSDRRLPRFNATLVLRGGSDSEPADKAGLADLTAQMVRRGTAEQPFLKLSQELESRGVTIEIGDDSDFTQINLSGPSDQIDYAVQTAASILAKPAFPQDEFDKLKAQAIGRLSQRLSSPAPAAEMTLASALYPESPLGVATTPQTLQRITLDDVKQWWKDHYAVDEATFVVSGDLATDDGPKLAETLTKTFDKTAIVTAADYKKSAQPLKRKIILVDNPQGQQATIRMGIRAYDIRSDEKYAGGVAGQVLSAGIDSRLGRYVRAEKGLTYGAYAFFRPGRHGGHFSGTVDTKPETAAEAIEAMIKVYNDLKRENVTAEELSDAQQRVAGDMIMETETIKQQADRRVAQILNGYPIDYYDTYPEKVGQVTADQVRAVMEKYVKDDVMTFVVVAPAAIKSQLERLGEVEVVPMPLKR